jgi:DNA-binding MarR family transcriptional regulator
MLQEEQFKNDISVNKAFMAKRVFDLHLLILKQAEEVYIRKEIVFPVAVSSVVLFLSSVDHASLAKISRALGQPHQLIAQRTKVLLKLGLIEGQQDPDDKRRTLYKLTQQGKEQSLLLNEYCIEAADAFNHLSEELGVDLHQLLDKAYKALETYSFAKRFPSYVEKNE